MIVNFRARGISRDAYKLPDIHINNNKKIYDVINCYCVKKRCQAKCMNLNSQRQMSS
jgi:hypothetical protein